MNRQPKDTLVDRAASKIENAFPESHTATVRVIWWDDGGYLQETVQSAADKIDIGFRATDNFPLDLRIGAVQEERQTNHPQVWYIGEAKAGRDWFRDIRETGGEITCSIEELTAELYEVNPWDIFDVERHDRAGRERAAEIINNRFATPGIPQYKALKEEIITKGGGQLLDHLLRDGWPEIDRDEDTVSEVRTRLRENHSIPIPEDATPEEITDRVRRWAVAQSLIDSGVDLDQFECGFAGPGHSPLTNLLEIRGDNESAHQYLGTAFWGDLIDELDNVWAYAECPVDGALDIALWNSWVEKLHADKLSTCIDRAQRRQAALSIYPSDSPWVGLWTQSEHIARLQQHFTEWEDRPGGTNPFTLYADGEDGSWRIDDQVLQLQLTGQPEESLPSTHPAVTTLPDLREPLLTSRYTEYLTSLAEAVKSHLQTGNPLSDQSPAYRWWVDHEDDFDKLGNVAIFLIDALRFDLAQRLATRLSDDFDVQHETRIATLPSETKFGMAALTPGRPFRFKLSMDDDTLSVAQGDRELTTKSHRVAFYEQEGWEVPDTPDSGWENQRIAYYDKEIDDVGEGEIGNIQNHFANYIDDLTEIIRRKLTDHNWDRIYVVTDHGFVLLPDGSTMESISIDRSNKEVKYRRAAGNDLTARELNVGIHLTPETAGLEYLNTNLQLLVDPRQYFSKQGYSDSLYYHGGILPQECVLSFLEIQD